MTKEQLEELKNCKTKEEVLDYLIKNKIELTEDELKSVSGGWPALNLIQQNLDFNAIYGSILDPNSPNSLDTAGVGGGHPSDEQGPKS